MLKHMAMVKRGVLLDSLWSYVAEGGQVAVLNDDSGKVEMVRCENIRLVKALRQAKGKAIRYQVDTIGVLVSFNSL